MTASRDRKDAARVLGIALQARYRRLLEATTEDEITIAAVDLGKTFNDNIEFAIWALRSFGGDSILPPEKAGKTPLVGFEQDNLPQMPAIFSAGADVDMIKR